ncbi:MAG TPA: polyprenyl synthetase family protein, partial [Candidatus Aminicenantes bacterium]|nr:polyprenyl synthetase family protein [Candidatus Aminicenantes bacterium]
QITDDLLDFTGRPDTLGKPVLTDLREGRITLPVIYALRKIDGPARTDFIARIAAREDDPSAVEAIRDAVLAAGAIAEAAAAAAAFTAKAKSFLPDETPTARTLAALADFVCGRNV